MKKSFLLKQLLIAFCLFFFIGGGLNAQVNVYAAGCSGSSLGNYPTIRAAVNAAAPFECVVVSAGTYNESVIVNKSLTIKGANAGVLGKGIRGAESIVDPNSSAAHGFDVQTDNVTIDGFTITNSAAYPSGFERYGVRSIERSGGGRFAGTAVKNNIISRQFKAIDFYFTDNFSISGNWLHGENDVYNYGCDWIASCTHGIITNNDLDGYSSAVEIQDAGSYLTISENRSTGGQYVLFAMQNSTVYRNKVLNVTSGSHVFIGGGCSNDVISENFFDIGTYNGIHVSNNYVYGANANLTITNNSITGHNATGKYEINVDPAAYTGILSAECNWYGTYDGAVIVTKVSGPVDYTPWLTNGTDNETGTPGFQPVAGSCNGPALYVNDNSLTGDIFTTAVGNDATGTGSTSAPFATIQHAITVAVTGTNIYADAGTYIENIIVNKEVTLTGAGESLTFIKPANSNPNCGGAGGGSLCSGGSNIILVRANNVTIKQLTLDGDNLKLKSLIKIAGADIDARNGIITDHITGVYSNLNVNHTTIKNIYLRGVYASTGGSFSFTNNTVSNVQGNTSAIALFNFGGAGTFANNNVSLANDAISSNWSMGSTYYGNTVTTSASGIHTDNNGGSGGVADNIHDNNVSNSLNGNGYGIWVFAPYRDVIINANTVTNVNVGLANFAQNVAVTPIFTNNTVDGKNRGNSTGVYQTSDELGFGYTNVSGVYYNNFIMNTTTGFSLEYHAGKTNTITVNSNSITGNQTGVKLGSGSKGAGTLVNSFQCNWWGTATPTLVKKAVSAAVNYTPYLNSGNDVSAEIGFQPTGTCTPSAVARIEYVSSEISINPKTNILSIPDEYKLANFPNPFSALTTIRYELPVDSKVSLKVYNSLGQAIATLVEEDKKAGCYNVQFNASKFAQGLYNCKLVATSGSKQTVQSIKLVVAK